MAFKQSSNQAIKQSSNQAIKQSSNQPFNQAINHSINHSIKQSTIQSSDQAIKRSSDQAIKRSSDQATLPYFYHFYQNRFKNPLLFIVPLFINPHRNLFKPFDSISPIFKSVGLTELNSIQGEDNGKSRSRVKKTPSNFSG